jgi:hypothetical protein
VEDAPNSKCTTCKNEYYVSAKDGLCVNCVDINCLLCDETACTECKSGFSLKGKCVLSSSLIPNCLSAGKDLKCKKCKGGFYLNEASECIECNKKNFC